MSARYPACVPVFRGPHGDVVGRPAVRNWLYADRANIGEIVDLADDRRLVGEDDRERRIILFGYRPLTRAARELLKWSRQS